MPEYLAPAVYVEEVDTGSKPIEGVSTSTAGMVGVTERGPVNIPILVTSYGEYQRWFGQTLNRTGYGEFRFLPHAVEGFFLNGGKRVYVTRVLDITQVKPAERVLVADAAVKAEARLLLSAGSGANNVVIDADPGFRIDSQSQQQVGFGIPPELSWFAIGFAKLTLQSGPGHR